MHGPEPFIAAKGGPCAPVPADAPDGDSATRSPLYF